MYIYIYFIASVIKVNCFAVFDQSGNFVIYATMLGIKGTTGVHMF